MTGKQGPTEQSTTIGRCELQEKKRMSLRLLLATKKMEGKHKTKKHLPLSFPFLLPLARPNGRLSGLDAIVTRPRCPNLVQGAHCLVATTVATPETKPHTNQFMAAIFRAAVFVSCKTSK
jgi:hypothetical protein